MKKELEPQEIAPEVDFSDGMRDKYAARFEEVREDLMSSAAALDRLAWLANSLRAFQGFESRLVAYHALVFGKAPESAGQAVSAMLEAPDEKPSVALWRDLREHTSASETFYEELRELLEDRSWLVHRSSYQLAPRRDASQDIDRFSSIAERSTRLSAQFSSFLLERCVAKGMDRAEVEERAEEVVERWVAGRDAA